MDETDRLHPADPRVDRATDQRDLVLGGDALRLVLQTVARTDLYELDPLARHSIPSSADPFLRLPRRTS